MGTAVTIIVGGIAVLWLLMMFTELFGVLFKSMRASEQETWEHKHMGDHGYATRRKQLWIHVVVTGGFMILFFALGLKCMFALEDLSGHYYPTGNDPYANALFGGGALFLLALVCAFRLGIVRAKFRAIRRLRHKFPS
jgi:hypothetical protein